MTNHLLKEHSLERLDSQSYNVSKSNRIRTNRSSYRKSLVWLSLTYLQLGNISLEWGQWSLRLTKSQNCNSWSLVSLESASSFGSLVECFNNRALPLHQLMTISDRLMDVSHHALSSLASTAAMDPVSKCIVCQDRACMPYEFLHISVSRRVIQVRKSHFHIRISRCATDRPNKRSQLRLPRRRKFLKRHFNLPNGRQKKHRTSATVD